MVSSDVGALPGPADASADVRSRSEESSFMFSILETDQGRIVVSARTSSLGYADFSPHEARLLGRALLAAADNAELPTPRDAVTMHLKCTITKDADSANAGSRSVHTADESADKK